MQLADVAIVGAGPAGSACAAFCAAAGLRTVVIDREKFPREKVCGDCINPACWPVFDRLRLTERVRALRHCVLKFVEFMAIDGQSVRVALPTGNRPEIAVKRSLLDDLLFRRAMEQGAEALDGITVNAVERTNGDSWKINAGEAHFEARILVAADGRNSTVARLCNLSPRPQRERIAFQAHISRPAEFGERVLLQSLKHGYSGQAPVNESELNLCLVARPRDIDALKSWAMNQFELPPDQPWRTITPLTRATLPPAHHNLFLIGDAARVVEPVTGEGIYYALRSGELAANAIAKIIRGQDQPSTRREFARAHSEMYRGRLWINRLTRVAGLSPGIAAQLIRATRMSPWLLRMLASRIVS